VSKHAAPPQDARVKVEKKVWAATAATFFTSGAIAVLNDVQSKPELLGSLPPLLQTLVILFGPPLVTFLSGYAAKHTPRDEQPQVQAP
jgi:hypothetical protein